jgi:hypothetical protein
MVVIQLLFMNSLLTVVFQTVHANSTLLITYKDAIVLILIYVEIVYLQLQLQTRMVLKTVLQSLTKNTMFLNTIIL